ncbi:uncharacterized protein ARMOST_08591 [Armillaria ostoyae]|uniref:Uncharacterized protein n=1 Tax=Armillaria ostoyae TaxID=47428 RepID=A0A284R931_ARMOS|nr:uncharacterized protein ARMOST_08591 [Armillaria ostoyae]
MHLQLKKDKEVEKKEKDKKQSKLGNFDLFLNVEKEADPILHLYAQKQLTDFKYYPLWYFMKIFTTEASYIVNTLAPDTLNLQQDSGSGLLSFQASSMVKLSKNTQADKNLSWSQFSYTFAWFLQAINMANWLKNTIQMFASMFLSLMLYSFRQWSNSKKSLLVYADDTRRQWHCDIEEGNCAPNLANIIVDHLENISNDLHNKAKVHSKVYIMFSFQSLGFSFSFVFTSCNVLSSSTVFLRIGCTMHNFFPIGCIFDVSCLSHPTSLIFRVVLPILMWVTQVSGPAPDQFLHEDTTTIIDLTIHNTIVTTMTNLTMSLLIQVKTENLTS